MRQLQTMHSTITPSGRRFNENEIVHRGLLHKVYNVADHRMVCTILEPMNAKWPVLSRCL